MVTHRDFESNCNRIAKAIQKQANDPTSDARLFGVADVWVSAKLIDWFNAEVRKDKKQMKLFEKEINKHLKGCIITWDTLGISGGWKLYFHIGFDDVDPEFEDW